MNKVILLSANSDRSYIILDGIEFCIRISFMKSAVYSHTTRKKCHPILLLYNLKLTLLRNTILMYTLYVSLQALQLSSTMLGICRRSRQDQTSLCWSTNFFVANYGCTHVFVFVLFCFVLFCFVLVWFVCLFVFLPQGKYFCIIT